MTDVGDTRLTSRRLPFILIGAAALLAIGLVVVIAVVVFGDDGDHPPTNADRTALADEVCPKVDNAHFYKIEKDGKTSYLLGTRHAGVRLAKYPKLVADAFEAATTVVFESVNEASPPPPPDGTTVEQALGPKLWQHYKDLVGDKTAAEVNRLGVQRATATLVLLYEDTTQAIDRELAALARDKRKRLAGLDDDTDHLGEYYLGVDTLKQGLQQVRRRDILEQAVRKGLRTYCSGTATPHESEFSDVTNNRTRKWVPKLETLLAEGNVFIAVGSAHVDDGTLGLVELLRADEYVVTAVR